MSDMIYRPGQWQVVIEESGVAALPADADADKVVALSGLLARGVPELTEVIDVLSGGAITGLGSFAVALIGPGGTRFAVRGAVTVTTGWQQSFSGEDITTWSERYLADEPRFEIGLGDADGGVEYPIRSGVVLASGIRVGDAFEAPVEVPAPADAEAEEAEPEEAPAEPEEAPAAEDAPAEPVAQGDAPVETIAPDEVAAIRAVPPAPEQTAEQPDEQSEEPQASVDQADLGATIVPPSFDAPNAAHVDASPADVVTPDVTLPPDAVADDLGIGDHDGATISLAEARRLRGASAPATNAPTSAPDAPTAALPVFSSIAGARSARIRLSTGQVVELDRPVIIGRKPRSTRSSGSDLPHLIAVESPESDISRNHLEVRPEGDSVVVIDLHTTNGSTLLRPGADPVRLHPGEQTLVLGGDVIDVGDGVTVAVEEF